MRKFFKPLQGNLPVVLSIAVPALIAVMVVPSILLFYLGDPDSRSPSYPASSAAQDSAAKDSAANGSFVPGSGTKSASDGRMSSGEEGPAASSRAPADISVVAGSGSFSSPDGSQGEYIAIRIEPARNRDTLLRTSAFFKTSVPKLEAALADSRRFSSTILLDPGTQTSAYILAENENYAANLNGYFYYLIDESASADMVSPAVLSISALFDESGRTACTGNGTFAQQDILDSLKASLKAALGTYYKDEIFDFIYSSYRKMFARKIKGEKGSAEAVKLVLPGIDVLYRDSFITYVEFYITK